MWVTPGDPGPSDVRFDVDTSADVHDISPYIYGTNQPDWNAGAKNLTLARADGQHRVEVQLWVGSACATKRWARGKPKAIEDLGDRRLLGERGDDTKSPPQPATPAGAHPLSPRLHPARTAAERTRPNLNCLEGPPRQGGTGLTRQLQHAFRKRFLC